MHIAAKLTAFLELSLQEKHHLSLPVLSIMHYLRERGWDRETERLGDYICR
jgi:hypothetical protein